MVRKSFVLMVVVFLLTASGFALFIHSLNTQAIEEETGDRRGFSFTEREKSGQDRVVNTIQPENLPPKQYWILLATDPDEGVGTNLKSIYYIFLEGAIVFLVEHYRNWSTIDDVDDGILIDTDRDSTTGFPDGTYPGQNTGIGADYLILVGYEGCMILRWDPDLGNFDWGNPIPLAGWQVPENSNLLWVALYASDIGNPPIIYGAVCDVLSDWDWKPDTGHFTCCLCNCGDANGDGTVDVADVMYLINYVFLGTAPPDCY